MEYKAMSVGFKKLHEDAVLPSFGNGDLRNAGIDFYAINSVTIKPKMYAIMDTGIAWDGLPLCTEYEKPVLIVQSRSGLAFNHGIEACNAGIIDAGYRGSIKVKLYNMSEVPYVINKGDRIAQGIVYMLPNIVPVEIEEFKPYVSERGEGGFGSTGS